MILRSLRNIDKDFLHPEISSKTSFFASVILRLDKSKLQK